MRKILLTGGMGFIGSNFLRYWLKKYPEDHVIILDNHTYAARPNWAIDAIEKPENRGRAMCLVADLNNAEEIRRILLTMKPDHVVHMAAESHVCRSIDGPRKFIETNIVGTFNLLEACRSIWSGYYDEHRFHHVSTDEVYGSLGLEERDLFHEMRRFDPTSPYAASKAASDLLVKSYFYTYGLNTTITNCSNNFGPNQHFEKLVPKTILTAMQSLPMTIYGPGTQVRDWIYVDDHSAAVDAVLHNGSPGHSYCVGGERELTNVSMVAFIRALIQEKLGVELKSELRSTDDRPTDDQRYAVDCSKIAELGWRPSPDSFKEKMSRTVDWYLNTIPFTRKA